MPRLPQVTGSGHQKKLLPAKKTAAQCVSGLIFGDTDEKTLRGFVSRYFRLVLTCIRIAVSLQGTVMDATYVTPDSVKKLIQALR